jgi:hypothetical protein
VHYFDPLSAASWHEQPKQAILGLISTVVWEREEKEKGKEEKKR